MLPYRRIALLGFTSLTGEDNQTGLVRLQTFNIEFLALLTKIPPPVINNNTNTESLLPSNTCLFQFTQCETTSFTDFTVVANGLSTNGGAEEGKGTNTEGGSFSFTSVAAAEFSSWLIKPCADAALPVLVEMVVVEDCMSLESFRRIVLFGD